MQTDVLLAGLEQFRQLKLGEPYRAIRYAQIDGYRAILCRVENELSVRGLIMLAALRLFARAGYEAVSVRDIAEQLDLTKGALYKHYANKRDIFDSIVIRMQEKDIERAKEFGVPEGVFAEIEEAYRNAALEDIKAFGLAQFRYWTEDESASSFRKMLTLG
ncbi:MAG: helix-turn-helix domain-containing protein [Symbiobacteriia bacterium]